MEMIKREKTREDGRYIIFYEFNDNKEKYIEKGKENRPEKEGENNV